MFNFLKKITPRFIKRIIWNEWSMDILFYFQTFHIFRDRKFKPFTKLCIPEDKDLALIFFVGIGDAIFGMPAFNEIKNKLHKKKLKLHAYVDRHKSYLSNPAVYELLKDSKIFDSVNYFTGSRFVYWKYYNWTSIENDPKKKFLPFLYQTKSSVNDRVEEIFRQYNLGKKKIVWPEFSAAQGNFYKDILKLLSNKHRTLFMHLETRSGEYHYPYINDVLDKLLDKTLNKNFNIVLFTSDPKKINLSGSSILKISSKFTGKLKIIELKSKAKILILNPQEMPIVDQMLLIKNKADLILAINSYLWAIGRMYDKELVGIHYLDSPDGHQFAYKNSFIFTPSKTTYKKTKNSFLASENYHFTRLKFNPLIVEFNPDAILQALHFSHKFGRL